MPNLKHIKNRIESVKSTRKITSAMKMVAAAKLRRAQDAVESARSFSKRMERMLGSLAASFDGVEGGPKLLAGTGSDETHLLVVFTSDRGLCGGFNGSIVREARRIAIGVKGEGKTIKLLCVGRKGGDLLKEKFGKDIIDRITGVGGKKGIQFVDVTQITERILGMFDAGEFDVCSILFNRFQSAMTQIVTRQQLIPFAGDMEEKEDPADAGTNARQPNSQARDVYSQTRPPAHAVYEFEPDEKEILEVLLPKNLGVQIYQALLDNAASENGARMTAMDSATRNAGEMIDKLTLTYNRTRQANITRELIEIISGAEAL